MLGTLHDMTTHANIDLRFAVANDDIPLADILPGHLMARRMQRHMMVGVAVLASVMLSATVLKGYSALQPMPDIVTFAARV